MSDLLLPGYAQIRLDGMPRGGTYDDTSNPKLGWHTWEGMSWPSAEGAFRKYPPHLGVFPPWPGREHLVGRHQYVALNRHAYAFAGSESDDEYIIQVEVAGFAKDMRNAPDVVLEWLAVNVVAPIEKAVGVPRTALRFYDTVDYPGKAPNYLASKRSVIRLTPAELRAFSGHLGHQHMPGDDDPNDRDDSGDAHWDPGALLIGRVLAYLGAPTSGEDVFTMAAHDRLDGQKALVRQLFRTYLLRNPNDQAELDWHVLALARDGYEARVQAFADSDEGRAVLARERKAAGL
jgi:hypothetical protein